MEDTSILEFNTNLKATYRELYNTGIFKRVLFQIAEIYTYNNITPKSQELQNGEAIQIADAFVRNDTLFKKQKKDIKALQAIIDKLIGNVLMADKNVDPKFLKAYEAFNKVKKLIEKRTDRTTDTKNPICKKIDTDDTIFLDELFYMIFALNSNLKLSHTTKLNKDIDVIKYDFARDYVIDYLIPYMVITAVREKKYVATEAEKTLIESLANEGKLF